MARHSYNARQSGYSMRRIAPLGAAAVVAGGAVALMANPQSVSVHKHFNANGVWDGSGEAFGGYGAGLPNNFRCRQINPDNAFLTIDRAFSGDGSIIVHAKDCDTAVEQAFGKPNSWGYSHTLYKAAYDNSWEAKTAYDDVLLKEEFTVVRQTKCKVNGITIEGVDFKGGTGRLNAYQDKIGGIGFEIDGFPSKFIKNESYAQRTTELCKNGLTLADITGRAHATTSIHAYSPDHDVSALVLVDSGTEEDSSEHHTQLYGGRARGYSIAAFKAAAQDLESNSKGAITAARVEGLYRRLAGTEGPST